MIFTAVHVTCNLDTVLVLVVKQWCASLRKKSVNLKGRGRITKPQPKTLVDGCEVVRIGR